MMRYNGVKSFDRSPEKSKPIAKRVSQAPGEKAEKLLTGRRGQSKITVYRIGKHRTLKREVDP